MSTTRIPPGASAGPAKMVGDVNIFATEETLRALVRQPTCVVSAEKPLSWHACNKNIAEGGFYLSNERENQYKALVYPGSAGRFNWTLRGSYASGDGYSLEEAKAHAQEAVGPALAAGWNPYAPKKEQGASSG